MAVHALGIWFHGSAAIGWRTIGATLQGLGTAMVYPVLPTLLGTWLTEVRAPPESTVAGGPRYAMGAFRHD
jgi:MFS family permease